MVHIICGLRTVHYCFKYGQFIMIRGVRSSRVPAECVFHTNKADFVRCSLSSLIAFLRYFSMFLVRFIVE